MTKRKRTFRPGNDRIAELAANPLIADEVARVAEETAAVDHAYMATLADIRKAENNLEHE